MNEKRKIRRHKTRDHLPVVDRESSRPIADLANLSTEGAMFISQAPVEMGQTFRCRLKLPYPIMDKDEINFDTVCRWSNHNNKLNCHESGHKLTNISNMDRDIISLLILRCVIDEWSDPDSESAEQAQESVGK